jgi:dTDP-4-amino-4,6-dideoxygalactose transaminase
MLAAHPTLRRTDVFPQRANDLRTLCGEDSLYLTYNARGALYQLLRSIPESEGSVVLLPAFHCTALVEPVAHSRFQAIFYRIKPDLSVDFDDLQSKALADVAVIVVIHFFGFPADLRPVMGLAERFGCYVLEDCAHSFLTLDGGRSIGHQGDFSIYSFYKAVPSLFGGGLRVNLKQFKFTRPQNKIPLKDSAVIAKRLLEQLIDNSQDGFLKRSLQYLENLRVARKRAKTTGIEPAAPGFVDDPYLFREDLALAGMPALCKNILQSSDWRGIMSVRRRNYELFNSALEENALLRKFFPGLPEGVCPWAYPVLVQDRARFEHPLRERGVPFFTFGEVLHPLLAKCDGPTRQDAEDLSRQLLMLPVHQNLSSEEVLRYAGEINRFFSAVRRTPSGSDSLSAATQPANLGDAR